MVLHVKKVMETKILSSSINTENIRSVELQHPDEVFIIFDSGLSGVYRSPDPNLSTEEYFIKNNLKINTFN